MKRFVSIVMLMVCASAMADKSAEYTGFSKECLEKNNVAQEDVRKIFMGELKPQEVTANLKCYFLCLAEKEGFMNGGVFQSQVFIEKMNNTPNKEAVNKTIAGCKDLKGTDSCDTVFKIMTCLIQNSKA